MPLTPQQVERRISREIARNLKEVLDKIRKEIGRVYEKYSKDGVLTHAEMTKYNRLESLYKKLEDGAKPYLRRNGQLIKRLQRDAYEASFFKYAHKLEQELGTGAQLNWGLFTREQIIEAVANELSDIAIRGVTGDALIGIRREMAQGLMQGVDYKKMARSIKKRMNGIASDYMRIVRTEGQRSLVLGQERTYQRAEDLGVETQWIWDAALDRKTRSSHGKLDGVPAQEDEGGRYWNTDVGRVAGPLQSGVASFDINCRCRVRAEIKDYGPKVRRITEDGVVPYVKYTDWAKTKGWTPSGGWPKK
jgi:uncharacterized protein with gpF-like domain